MLLPPPSPFTRIPRCTSSLMSRRGVSCEHFAIWAYFEIVSLPSKPAPPPSFRSTRTAPLGRPFAFFSRAHIAALAGRMRDARTHG